MYLKMSSVKYLELNSNMVGMMLILEQKCFLKLIIIPLLVEIYLHISMQGICHEPEKTVSNEVDMMAADDLATKGVGAPAVMILA